MYIGGGYDDSRKLDPRYYSYAAQPCDWWNVGCHAGAWFHNTVEGAVKTGTETYNKQISPILITAGIAALGIFAIIMVAR
jgi:hypothetical protein